MRLVIGWLVLMLILPLLYLFWWKKGWRLVLGIIILVILGLSFFVPSEIVYSLVNRKIKKEQQNLIHQRVNIRKKLENLAKQDFSTPPDSENPQKFTLEKEIAQLTKETKEENDNHAEVEKKKQILEEKRQEWIQKWSEEKFPLPLLFPGKELTAGLERLKKHEKYSISMIDLAKHNQVEPVQKEMVNLIKKIQLELAIYERYTRGYTYIPLLWFKNIDQVEKGSELENFLTTLFTNKKNNELWEYQEEKINLSKFIFVANTTNPYQSLSSTLQTKLNHYESFLDKYRLTIFLASGVGEIILFFILIRTSRKNRNIIAKQKTKKIS